MYAFRCGYCGVSETECGSELTYDHFRPHIQNGSDNAANLVYACHACNEYKGDYWSEAADTRLLHPLTDSIGLHVYEEADGTLRPNTPLGELYVARLQLNRPALVTNRLTKQRAQRLEEHLSQITNTLNELLLEVESSRSRDCYGERKRQRTDQRNSSLWFVRRRSSLHNPPA